MADSRGGGPGAGAGAGAADDEVALARVQKVEAIFPEHEWDEFAEHFWDRIQTWREAAV